MKNRPQNPSTLLAVALGLSVFLGLAQIAPADDIAAKPYKILATTQIPAAGRIDYVTADCVNRRVYVACGDAVSGRKRDRGGQFAHIAKDLQEIAKPGERIRGIDVGGEIRGQIRASRHKE